MGRKHILPLPGGFQRRESPECWQRGNLVVISRLQTHPPWRQPLWEWWSPTSSTDLSFWLILSVHSLVYLPLSPQMVHLLVSPRLLGGEYTFIPLKYSQPSGGTTPRQVFKSFRLELAKGLIGNYFSQQCYALPTALHDAAHNFTSTTAKGTRDEYHSEIPQHPPS